MNFKYKKAGFYLFFLLLVGILSFISFRNVPWLSGWDTLHTEFNFLGNVRKLFSGGWDESRGLGIVNGMAQVADLPRTLTLWLLSVVMPVSWLRMGWMALTWFVGMVGVWKLFDDGVVGEKYKNRRIAGIVASIFYLFNVGTVLTFFLPFEPFTGFFGVLPWLIWGTMRAIMLGRRNDYLNLLFIYVLGSSAFYVQTLFVVWAITLTILGIDGIGKYGTQGLKRFGIVLLITLSANLYWLAPVAYFTLTQASVVGESAGNLLSTGQMQLINQGYGNVGDIAQMKGYLLSYISWLRGDNYGLVAENWEDFLNLGYVMILGYFLFAMSIFGLVVSLFKKHREILWVGLFILSYLMLAMSNPPFGGFYDWMSKNIPLFAQIFRVPYTKWLPIYILVSSVSMGIGISWISEKWKKGWTYLFTGVILIVIFARVSPIFKGQMISDKVRVDFPREYFKLFEFMKKQSNGRLVELPAHSMWGWNTYNWGYEGSGFLWYGIEQPILDRAFDVWSPYNEGFYNEFSTALYGCESNSQITNSQILKLNCGEQVAKVLQKYDVKYVLLDESVIVPGQDKEILRIEETKKLAKELGWERKFHEKFLTVWDTGITAGDKYVSAPSSYTLTEGDTSKVREDVVYGDDGTYISASRRVGEAVVAYPFAGLMREEIGGENGTENIEYRDDRVTLSTTVSQSHGDTVSQVIIPGWKVGDIVRIEYRDGEPMPAYYVNGQPGPKYLGKEKPEERKNIIYARVGDGEEWSEYLTDGRFNLQGQTLQVEVSGQPQIYDFGKDGAGTIGNCDVLKRGTASKSQGTYSADERGAVCDYVVMSELDTRLAYLMRIQGENREGRSLKYFLYNTGSKRNDIEYLLGKNTYDQTFSLLPWEWDGTYTLNIETRSFGQRAENIVKPVEVRWLPIEQIARARILSTSGETPPASGVPTRDSLGSPVEESPQIRSELRITGVTKTGTWLYIVETQNGGLLKLSQGYDDGWVSPYLEHVKVDGWANGWMVPSGEHQIVIFYWPQLLQYLGFVMLGSTILWLVLSRKTE